MPLEFQEKTGFQEGFIGEAERLAGPQVRQTDTLEDGRSILSRHRKALAGVGCDPGNRRCVSGTQEGGLPGQL